MKIIYESRDNMASKIVQLVTKGDTDTYVLIAEALHIYDDYLHSVNDLRKALKVRVLIEELIKSHKKLNKSQLRREKYNLIKEIKENYDVNDFFKAKITDYKIMASIFNLLENREATPLSIVNSKVTILEHITEKQIKPKKDTSLRYRGKLYLKSDWKPEMLRVIYEFFDDKIVDLYLDNKIKCPKPKLINDSKYSYSLVTFLQY